MEILARGVGRRKEAVAQVKLVKGTGQFIINDIPYHQYLHNNTCSLISVKAPLTLGMPGAPLQGAALGGGRVKPPFGDTAGQNQSLLKEKMTRPRSLTGEALNVPSSTAGVGATPLTQEGALEPMDNLDTIVKVKGGGLIGQSEAIKLGLARAICQLLTPNPSLSNVGGSAEENGAEEIRKQLKDKGYLTQDSRVKERRKYGLKKARKASQYHKR